MKRSVCGVVKNRKELYLAEETDVDTKNVLRRQVVDLSIDPGIKAVAQMILRFGIHFRSSHTVMNAAIVLVQRVYHFRRFDYFDPDFEEYAVGADQLAMAAMQFLRASRGSVDRARLQRLGTPSHVAFWIKEYEIELFATTGFYFPANYPHLLQSVATKIKAPRELAKEALKTINSLLVGTNVCVMYRPLTVVAIAVYTTCLRTSTGIPNPEGCHTWYSCVDPSLSLSFLHNVSQVVLKLLPNKSVEVKKEVVPEVEIKKEPFSIKSRSVSPDSGIESPPFTVKMEVEDGLQW